MTIAARIARRTTDDLDFSLGRLRRIALAVFALQLLAMLVWSHVLWSRFALTDDYAQYWQAWWKVSQGHLNPYDSVALHSFWKDHAVVLMWPIALVTHWGLGGYTPMAVQDILIVSAELVAFSWLLELLRERDLGLVTPNWAVGAVSVLLLVANPWIYWAASFDVHFDVVLPAPFVVLALRALYYRRYHQLALWTVLILLCGDVAATFTAAVGITGLLASVWPGQRRVVASAAVLIAGLAGYLVISHLGGNSGSSAIVQTIAHGHVTTSAGAPAPTNASESLQILLHPWRVAFAPFHNLRNVWALLTPAGLLGLLSVWSLPLAAVVAVENTAAGSFFSAVTFQYLVTWAPLVVGGVFTTRLLSHRRWGRILATGLIAVSVLNSVGWVAVWLPTTNHTWIQVDSGAAKILSEAQQMIPPDAEVIASQGVIGRFSDRNVVFAFPGNRNEDYPVERHEIYFIVAPFQGLEIVPVNETLDLLGNLAGPVGAKLVLHGHGIWVFKWDAPESAHTIDASAGYDEQAVPVWATRSAIGAPTFNGPSSDWTMSTTSRAGGYLLYGAYFQRTPGDYVLRVKMSSSGTANVEAWDDYANVLLGRRVVPETNRTVTVDVPVHIGESYPPPLFRGHFLFKRNPQPPLGGQPIEARIYLPPATTGVIYSVALLPAGGLQ
jgi:hypothetical protein